VTGRLGRPSPAVALILVQVALVLGFGLFVAGRQAFWGAIDEAAHASYVAKIAEHGRLPILGRDCMDPALIGLERVRTGPPVTQPDCGHVMATASYEAFQPPLAYALYAPVYRLPFSLRARAYLLRVANLLTLLVAFGVVARFARREFGAGWSPVLAVAALFFLVPGVLVRSAAVSNGALEILLATLFLAQAWTAARTGSATRLLVAGGLLGLALLTKLTLAYLAGIYVIAAIAVLRRRPGSRTVVAAVAGASLAALLFAPWLAFNHHHYGTLTANSQARRMQQSVVNPTRHHFGAGDVPARALLTVDLLPEEWEPSRRPKAGDSLPLGSAGRLAESAALLAALCALLAAGLRAPERRRWAWLLLPAVLSLGLLLYTMVSSQFDIVLPRYLYPAGPAAAVALGAAVAGRFPRLALPLAGAATVGLAVLFLVYAHPHYGLV
jgi:4-amino-4-deoxy-L-arabinose transferase-like glycosyltransferase